MMGLKTYNQQQAMHLTPESVAKILLTNTKV